MDKETLIKGCENWVNNHKGENFLLTYSSVVELLSVLKANEPVMKHNDCTDFTENRSEADIANQMGLKLCPFCGSEAKIVTGTEYVNNIGKDTFNIVCTNPECIIFGGYGRSFYTLENAKNAWNQRRKVGKMNALCNKRNHRSV